MVLKIMKTLTTETKNDYSGDLVVKKAPKYENIDKKDFLVFGVIFVKESEISGD
jgi:hypothetical protein